MIQRVQLVDDLIKIVSDAVKFFSQKHQFRHEFIQGAVTCVDGYRPMKDDTPQELTELTYRTFFPFAFYVSVLFRAEPEKHDPRFSLFFFYHNPPH